MDGKSWIKRDLSHAEASDVAGGQRLRVPETGRQEPGPGGPPSFTGSKDVKKVGTEKIDGVETTHYKGHGPLDRFRKESLKNEKARPPAKQREKSP